jgi:hypothetical protein
MLIRMLAVASSLVAAACAADGSKAGDPSQANDVENPEVGDQPPPESPAPEGLVLNNRRAECASDGPCSPACATNDEVIDIHVPNGQCITFDCTSDAGGTDVGGCHP